MPGRKVEGTIALVVPVARSGRVAFRLQLDGASLRARALHSQRRRMLEEAGLKRMGRSN